MRDMKKVFLAALSLTMMLSGAKLFAQDMSKYGPNADECVKYLSYYTEYYKQKNYDDAVPNWRQAYKICPPTCSQNLLIHGSDLISRLIAKNAKNTIMVEGLIDTLMTLQDQRAEFYPKYAATALNNKANYATKFIKNDNKRVYDIYEGVIESLGDKTKASVLFNDFKTAVELYGEGGIGTEQVLDIYQRNLEMLNAITPSSDVEKKQIDDFRTNIENLFISSKVASCEDLLALFGPRYEANPNDLALATNIVKMLSLAEDCNDNELFLNAVTTMYTLDPSADAAYYLYKLHAARGNVANAVNYLQEAIEKDESDVKQDAAYLYELAVYSFKNGRSASAFEAASKVPSMDESLAGKAYLLIGTIWGSTSCGGDEIARRAPYWVACDYMNKAKAADPSLTEEANRYIGQYSRYFPQAAEAFMYDVTNGQSYTVACGGMRATTTVRTTK
jgi:tetratricopeptide (TPR) repeat protein